MRASAVMAGVVVLAVTLCRAQDPEGAPVGEGKPRALSVEEIGKRSAGRRAQVDKEIAALDAEAARQKSNPDASAMAGQLKTALVALNENLKAQAEAAQAGDLARATTLRNQSRELETTCAQVRGAIQWLRQAADIRASGRSLPPASGDAGASREKYVTALNALAAFYEQQARNLPESPRLPPPEARNTENALKLARDRAKIEYDYQELVTRARAKAERHANDPAAKASCDTLIEKAGAARDAQLKVMDLQDALVKALTARSQAETELDQAKDEQAAGRSKAAPCEPGRGKDAATP